MNPSFSPTMEAKNNKSGKILVLGANGQVGRALARFWDPHPVIAATRRQVDLSHPKKCVDYLERIQPNVVFNAAAYTQVDLAEKETDLARRVNADAPGEIARWCAQKHIPFVHFSTDYVFSGKGTLPWTEEDPIAPLNSYGKTKAEGEQQVVASEGQYLIFRTSWVYDSAGKNFLNTMLKLGKERETLKIVNDQFGAPTYAFDLARAAAEALELSLKMASFPSGIYHLCNRGETTWFQFAQVIFESCRKQSVPLQVKELVPILSSEFPTPAERPKNSRLCTKKMHDVFGILMPEWRDSLQVCLQEVYESHFN